MGYFKSERGNYDDSDFYYAIFHFRARCFP